MPLGVCSRSPPKRRSRLLLPRLVSSRDPAEDQHRYVRQDGRSGAAQDTPQLDSKKPPRYSGGVRVGPPAGWLFISGMGGSFHRNTQRSPHPGPYRHGWPIHHRRCMSGLRLVSDGAEYPNRERVGRYVTVLSDHGFDQRSATGVTEATCRLFPALAPPARPAGQARALLADLGSLCLPIHRRKPRKSPGRLTRSTAWMISARRTSRSRSAITCSTWWARSFSPPSSKTRTAARVPAARRRARVTAARPRIAPCRRLRQHLAVVRAT